MRDLRVVSDVILRIEGWDEFKRLLVFSLNSDYCGKGDFWGKNPIIKTRPDGQPTMMSHAATAEHDGRYSDGSQSTFSPFHVIHILSALKP